MIDSFLDIVVLEEMTMYKRWMSDDSVRKRYVEAGSMFGNAVSYLYLGECLGFRGMLSKWAKWEREYARRGYRTIPIEVFIEHGGYNIRISGLGIRRARGEPPILHAGIYRERFLGKIPLVVLSRSENSVVGAYALPCSKEEPL